ncbi:hypothetical protein IQ273_23955 [Nodosilinea sp. LEGE 07298]|uniref:hypothetical protein n=1 Tax=Nodosilinea sp. LEGE 07298 TaxID=2777970 RepID=UPI001882762C|nr:hypothetical protein [Nodosilinea sp. LEGE 07298]MBE9112451.1 hypothetical protein [Nodosilinea sp. LEGE 07298]
MTLYEDICQVHESLIREIEQGYKTDDELVVNAIESWLAIFYPSSPDLRSIKEQCLISMKESQNFKFLWAADNLVKAVNYSREINYWNSQRSNSVQSWSYLIVGLVIVVLATIIFYGRQGHRGRERLKAEKNFDKDLTRSTKSLFIIVNAERDDLISALSNVSQRSTDVNWKMLSDKLYKSSKALWMGSSQSPEAHDIREVLQRLQISEFKSDLNSEYDVHIVEISLKEGDKGFDRNANPIDRRDAFENLVSNCTKIVQVSSRFSSSSCEGLGFYI